MKDKTKLRKSVKNELSRLSKEVIQKKSKLLAEYLYLYIENLVQNSSTALLIGGFSPLEDEPRWNSFHDWSSLDLSYPLIVKGGEMVFKRSQASSLVENIHFGKSFLEPLPSSETVTPNLLIVPGLAFSRKGERLGRGAGFYDRFLANDDFKTIGIAFDEQIKSNIPCEEHDRKVDALITDLGIFFS